MSGEVFFGKESLISRLTIAEEAITALEKLIQIPEEEVLENPIYRFALKGACIVYIQAILDIGNYIIADKELGVPSSYEDIISMLQDNNMISNRGFERLKEFLKIRDKILHSSEAISYKILLNIIKENIGFFKELLNSMKLQMASLSKTE